MNPKADIIIALLNQVTLERARRASNRAFASAVVAVKRYQQRRFMHTYADLLSTERFGAASRFFLDELYGPRDFSQRDAQFVRVVPALVRLFPAEIVQTVEILARLHAVSEVLDSAMALHVGAAQVTQLSYTRAWQATARRSDRDLQITLTLAVGSALDRYTQRRTLRHTLRLMRGPAKAAGLGELQRFLETGFDTFREMRGAGDFLDLVDSREQTLADALFNTALVETAAQDGRLTARNSLAAPLPELLPPDGASDA